MSARQEREISLLGLLPAAIGLANTVLDMLVERAEKGVGDELPLQTEQEKSRSRSRIPAERAHDPLGGVLRVR